MRKSLIACALAFLSFPLAAQADDDPYGPRAANGVAATIEFLDVYYGDLNLSHPAGADVLLSRIHFAARQVCGGLPDIREVRERMHFKRCFRGATEDAVHQVDAPLLTARFIDQERIEYGTASRW